MGTSLSLTDIDMIEIKECVNKISMAQHNCAECNVIDCPRRNTSGENFKILSDYASYEAEPLRPVIGIDIGTTTLAFEEITSDGKRFFFTDVNPQRRFGADVLSRIESAEQGKAEEMHNIITQSIVRGVQKLIGDSKTQPEKIVISGNTTMMHLLLSYPCKDLGVYPFKPYSTDTVHTTFARLTGSNVCDAEIDIICPISAFVGGDIVSGLYACNIYRDEDISLFVDLGTNGELALGNKEKILVSSTAAGPAFEGGKIRCGNGSVDGAICGVDINDNGVNIRTIGEKKANGICGTGIIELCAELLESSAMDYTGLLKEEYFEKGFKLTENTTVYQSDIREIQIAKSAVRTGIEILAEEYGIEIEKISKVFLAGAFGKGLNPEKACKIGLIPKQLKDKVVPVGNTSLGGAIRYALSDDGKECTEYIQKISENISLAENPKFNELYINNMNF